MDQKQFVSEMAKLRPASTFLTLLGYRNAYSEIADYNIIFHVSYKNALKRSLSILNALDVSEPIQIVAKQELIDSYTASLFKVESTPIEEVDDAYTRFFDEDGNYIKGIKCHTETNVIHLYGFVNAKRVIMPGSYPIRNKKTLTVAKDHLRKMLPVEKFRQFILTPNHVDSISVQGMHLLPPA